VYITASPSVCLRKLPGIVGIEGGRRGLKLVKGAERLRCAL
jgi:hypothetical protein